jgi:signal transduction histidine kinase
MPADIFPAEKILIVDDSTTNLVVLGDYLSFSGLEVIAVTNGRDCCIQAKAQKPDLILLDIMMPGIDGFETLHFLKQDKETQQIPVIFMSALSQTEHKVRGFAEGAVDYIIKPFQQEEVLARVTAHLTIQQQKTQLRELVATKDKLFSIIAHDLRAPFTALIGYSDLLLQQYQQLDDDKILKAIDRINSCSKEAFTILENLLTWARSQMGKLTWQSREMNLHLLIESVLSLLKVNAQKKEILIENKVAPEFRVFGSHEMLSTILRNLLSNAVKYTRQKGQIGIHAADTGEMLDISIADTGVGIAKEHLDKLFRIDSMFSTVGTANETGTGLGLMLCKEFVDKLGGTINVDSQEGVGTVFTISLPKLK